MGPILPGGGSSTRSGVAGRGRRRAYAEDLAEGLQEPAPVKKGHIGFCPLNVIIWSYTYGPARHREPVVLLVAMIGSGVATFAVVKMAAVLAIIRQSADTGLDRP